MTPRPYQENCLGSTHAAWDRGVKRLLVQMPTGTGKTNVFLWLIQGLIKDGRVSPHRPAVILAHREELLQQPVDRLMQMDGMLRVGVERADSKAPAGCEIIVASVQTVGRPNQRLANVKPGLVIVDECHHAAAESYHIALRKMGCFSPDGPYLVGFTATPKRLDRQALYDHDQAVFEEVAFKYGIEEAIDDGWLAPVRGFRVKTGFSLDGIRTRGGEFVDSDLAKELNTAERTHIAIERWKEVAAGRKTIVFCCDVEHAEAAAKQWQEETGAPSVCVSGRLDPIARSHKTNLFRNTPGAIMTNVDIATEGFDVPDTSCIVMLRPTQSGARYIQCVGRGLRLHPEKNDCVVLDVVDNTKKHSLVNLPALLDLPPQLDLQGKTLREARDKMRKLGEASVAKLREAQPETLSELDTLLEAVDLFAKLEAPAEVRRHSKLRWLESGGGGFVLSFPGSRCAMLAPDAIGNYWLHRLEPEREWPRVNLGPDLAGALARADAGLMKMTSWLPGNSAVLVQSDARWVKNRPTDKQLGLLRKLKVEEAIIRNLETCGQASSLIDQLLAKKDGARSSFASK